LSGLSDWLAQAENITHGERKAADALRNLWFQRAGWRVLRFSDERFVGDPLRVAVLVA